MDVYAKANDEATQLPRRPRGLTSMRVTADLDALYRQSDHLAGSSAHLRKSNVHVVTHHRYPLCTCARYLHAKRATQPVAPHPRSLRAPRLLAVQHDRQELLEVNLPVVVDIKLFYHCVPARQFVYGPDHSGTSVRRGRRGMSTGVSAPLQQLTAPRRPGSRPAPSRRAAGS